MAKRSYKILYIGNFHPLSVGEPEIAKSLEELGHTVIRLPEKDTSLIRITNVIGQEKPDFLLFAKFRVGEYGEKAEFLKALKIPSVMWGFDLYYGL